MTTAITTLTDNQKQDIITVMGQTIASMTQSHLDYSKRSLTAKNYAVAISQYQDFAKVSGFVVPTYSALEAWRDTMKADGYAVSTINTKLAGMRQLLNKLSKDITDPVLKMNLRDWASVEGLSQPKVQDADNETYGKRLTLKQLKTWLDDIDTSDIKGLRDKAILATLAYTGVRIFELENLTIRDLFLSETTDGLRACRVQSGKRGKSRMVVYSSYEPKFLEYVQNYLDTIGKSPMFNADDSVFYGTINRKGTIYTTKTPLKKRALQKIVSSYPAPFGKQDKLVQIAAHDLRRTYAKLCRDAGMAWDALQLQLGHDDIKTTQQYVGMDVDNNERMPAWE